MSLIFKIDPDISVKKVAELRRLVGWEEREKEISRVIGDTFMTAGCFEGEQLVGFVDVLSDKVEDALIRSLVVHPDYQRMGIALKLLEMVIERIKAEKIKTINVLFEPELEQLYRKAGFKIVSGGLIENEAEGS